MEAWRRYGPSIISFQEIKTNSKNPACKKAGFLLVTNRDFSDIIWIYSLSDINTDRIDYWKVEIIMSFFNPKKQKITTGTKGEMVTFNIKYYKSKTPKKYKLETLGKIIGSTPTLAVINTRFMYKEQKSNFVNKQQELLNHLNSSGIKYIRIPVKRHEETSIFGLIVKQGDPKVFQDYVIGLIVEGAAIEAIVKLFDKYSMYYYIDCCNCSSDEILDKFEASFDDEEKLKTQFKYYLFDDNFMGNMVVYCKDEDSSYISGILE